MTCRCCCSSSSFSANLSIGSPVDGGTEQLKICFYSQGLEQRLIHNLQSRPIVKPYQMLSSNSIDPYIPNKGRKLRLLDSKEFLSKSRWALPPFYQFFQKGPTEVLHREKQLLTLPGDHHHLETNARLANSSSYQNRRNYLKQWSQSYAWSDSQQR